VNEHKLPRKKIAFKDNYKDLLQGQGQGFDIQGQGQGQGHENCP